MRSASAYGLVALGALLLSGNLFSFARSTKPTPKRETTRSKSELVSTLVEQKLVPVYNNHRVHGSFKGYADYVLNEWDKEHRERQEQLKNDLGTDPGSNNYVRRKEEMVAKDDAHKAEKAGIKINLDELCKLAEKFVTKYMPGFPKRDVITLVEFLRQRNSGEEWVEGSKGGDHFTFGHYMKDVVSGKIDDFSSLLEQLADTTGARGDPTFRELFPEGRFKLKMNMSFDLLRVFRFVNDRIAAASLTTKIRKTFDAIADSLLPSSEAKNGWWPSTAGLSAAARLLNSRTATATTDGEYERTRMEALAEQQIIKRASEELRRMVYGGFSSRTAKTNLGRNRLVQTNLMNDLMTDVYPLPNDAWTLVPEKHGKRQHDTTTYSRAHGSSGLGPLPRGPNADYLPVLNTHHAGPGLTAEHVRLEGRQGEYIMVSALSRAGGRSTESNSRTALGQVLVGTPSLLVNMQAFLGGSAESRVAPATGTVGATGTDAGAAGGSAGAAGAADVPGTGTTTGGFSDIRTEEDRLNKSTQNLLEKLPMGRTQLRDTVTRDTGGPTVLSWRPVAMVIVEEIERAGLFSMPTANIVNIDRKLDDVVSGNRHLFTVDFLNKFIRTIDSVRRDERGHAIDAEGGTCTAEHAIVATGANDGVFGGTHHHDVLAGDMVASLLREGLDLLKFLMEGNEDNVAVGTEAPLLEIPPLEKDKDEVEAEVEAVAVGTEAPLLEIPPLEKEKDEVEAEVAADLSEMD